jgi:hypothetical protein
MKVYKIDKDGTDVFFGEVENKGFFYYKNELGEFGNYGTFLYPIKQMEKELLESIDVKNKIHESNITI